MSDTIVPPVDVPVSGQGSVSPVAGRIVVSGGCEPSAVSGVVQDWYTHTQSMVAIYQRKEQWSPCNNKQGTAPTVEYNYVDANVTVTTQDQILYNTTFSACAQVLQEVVLAASGACSSTAGTSGLGQQGAFYTSGQGSVLRPVRKNSAGVILDPSGTCNNTFNINLNKTPGAYSCSSGFDTLAMAKAEIATMVQTLPTYCPTFMPGLVNI